MRRPVLFAALVAALFPLVALAGLVTPRPVLAAGYEEGLRALDEGRSQEALAIWTALAESGDASAAHGLGRLYETGAEGVETDTAAAARWYRRAAEAGIAAAQNNLARLYADGDGVPRDLALAAQLWERAAHSGHPTAQYNLGLLLLRGETLARDEAQGAAWVEQAAEAGVPAAQFVLGDLRRYGIGGVRDSGLALAWYLRAAAAGHETARAEAERLQAAGVLPDRLPEAGRAAAPQQAPHDMTGQRPAGQAAAPLPAISPPKPTDLRDVAETIATEDARAGMGRRDGERFGVWLGSAGDAEAAERLGSELAARHRAALQGSGVTVQRVEVAGLGAVYRLFAGVWRDREAALRACAELRAVDGAAFCAPARY